MLKLLVEMKVDGPAPDMLVKRRCWWQFFDVGDIFRHAGDFLMLRIGHQIIKLDTKISKLSPTDFISNIRHQHRCSRLIPIQSKRSRWHKWTVLTETTAQDRSISGLLAVNFESKVLTGSFAFDGPSFLHFGPSFFNPNTKLQKKHSKWAFTNEQWF